MTSPFSFTFWIFLLTYFECSLTLSCCSSHRWRPWFLHLLRYSKFCWSATSVCLPFPTSSLLLLLLYSSPVFDCGCFITSSSMFLGCCFILPCGCCGFFFGLLGCCCCGINLLHDCSFKFTVALFELGSFFILHIRLTYDALLCGVFRHFLYLCGESFFLMLESQFAPQRFHDHFPMCFMSFASASLPASHPVHEDVVQLLFLHLKVSCMWLVFSNVFLCIHCL